MSGPTQPTQIDQASLDRAVAVLLELAEDQTASFDDRFSASAAVVSAATSGFPYTALEPVTKADES